MKIDLLKLKLNQVNQINIDNVVMIDPSYYENTDIKNIGDVKIKGKVIYHGADEFEILLNIKCELTLICSVSLKDVKMPVDIDINEYISQMDENIEENNKIINNTIDLIPIIWQNIILEVPLKVISDEASRENLSGDGWRLITDEKDLKEEIDPRLEGFKKFLNE